MLRSHPPSDAFLPLLGPLLGLVLVLPFASGCTSAQAATRAPVAAAAPPKDDGSAAKGGSGGAEHGAALEQLKTAPVARRDDRQGSIMIPLPDAPTWMRVRFWSVPSLVGFRYGKEHHAVVGAFITHVEDNAVPGACTKSFEAWANPWIEAFEVELHREPPIAVGWHARPDDAKTARIVEIDSVFAKTATIVARDSYAAVYAAYPAWGSKACLIVGMAVPSRGEDARAKDVRDRFAREVLPKVEVLSAEEPKERY